MKKVVICVNNINTSEIPFLITFTNKDNLKYFINKLKRDQEKFNINVDKHLQNKKIFFLLLEENQFRHFYFFDVEELEFSLKNLFNIYFESVESVK